MSRWGLHDVGALVLAAGKSTRIGAALDGRSKVLAEVNGQTVLERNLIWLRDSAVRSVWVNVHHQADAVKAAVGDGGRFGLSIRYSEEPALLGTAGAFRKLAQHWPEISLVVYGDNVSAFDLVRLVRHHEDSKAIATLALFDEMKHGNSGIAGGKAVVEDGRVVGFLEGVRASHLTLVNAGVYALSRRVLDFIPPLDAPDFGRDVFPSLIAAGEVLAAHVIEAGGYCYGIDTPEALARARDALAMSSSR